MSTLLARGARVLTRPHRALQLPIRQLSDSGGWPRIDAASVVDDATAAAFRRDGAVKLEGLASPQWVEALAPERASLYSPAPGVPAGWRPTRAQSERRPRGGAEPVEG